MGWVVGSRGRVCFLGRGELEVSLFLGVFGWVGLGRLRIVVGVGEKGCFGEMCE